MWISRKYKKTLKALFKQFPAVVVTGPRQVGKTALVRKIFPDADYISLDLPSVAAEVEGTLAPSERMGHRVEEGIRE